MHGRIVQTLDTFPDDFPDDFPDAGRDFVLRYGPQCLVETSGHLRPAAACQSWLDRNLPCAAWCNLLPRGCILGGRTHHRV